MNPFRSGLLVLGPRTGRDSTAGLFRSVRTSRRKEPRAAASDRLLLWLGRPHVVGHDHVRQELLPQALEESLRSTTRRGDREPGRIVRSMSHVTDRFEFVEDVREAERAGTAGPFGVGDSTMDLRPVLPTGTSAE